MPQPDLTAITLDQPPGSGAGIPLRLNHTPVLDQSPQLLPADVCDCQPHHCVHSRVTARRIARVALALALGPALVLLAPGIATESSAAAAPQLSASGSADGGGHRSLTDRSMSWPDRSQWRRVLLLQDYNTRVVVLGTMLLGLSGGLVGGFTLLRRRALMGDALSHATLPGIGLAFLLAPQVGLDGKSLPVLLGGAALSGVAGMVSILFIRNLTRLKEDAALGIVLSVFFGAGVAILSIVQQTSTGSAAGLETFIWGKTASMLASDARLIAWTALLCSAVVVLLFKELTLLCFDEGFAGARGFPVLGLDLILMVLVVFVTIIGLQAVGLVLMIALLVIPAAAARFWTHRLSRLTIVSGLLGAVSCLAGSAMSALLPRLPSGPMIVLVSGLTFCVSMLLGPERGIGIRWLRRRSLNRSVDRQHLLRGIYELLEARGQTTDRTRIAGNSVAFADVVALRSWSAARLRRQIRRSVKEALVVVSPDGGIALTAAGAAEAARRVREHRLWELYLITHADIAASRVDRDADRIEHVLDAEMIRRLEDLLEQRRGVHALPQSPHPLIPDTGPELPGAHRQGAHQPDQAGGSQSA